MLKRTYDKSVFEGLNKTGVKVEFRDACVPWLVNSKDEFKINRLFHVRVHLSSSYGSDGWLNSLEQQQFNKFLQEVATIGSKACFQPVHNYKLTPVYRSQIYEKAKATGNLWIDDTDSLGQYIRNSKEPEVRVHIHPLVLSGIMTRPDMERICSIAQKYYSPVKVVIQELIDLTDTQYINAICKNFGLILNCYPERFRQALFLMRDRLRLKDLPLYVNRFDYCTYDVTRSVHTFLYIPRIYEETTYKPKEKYIFYYTLGLIFLMRDENNKLVYDIGDSFNPTSKVKLLPEHKKMILENCKADRK